MNMSFKDAGWAARFEALGDEAEGVFEYVAEHELELGFTRYGLNRPPIRLGSVPARIRYSPDYLMSSKFVEVQGLGRDQELKLKLDKWGALHWWADVHPVDLFVWDSHGGRWCFLTLAQLDDLLGCAELKSFPEGKPYFSFPADAVFEGTLRYGELADALAA